MNLNLSEKLSYIGFRLSLKKGSAQKNIHGVDVEETLIEAAREVPNDSKMLSLICSWVSVHGGYVVVDKLQKKMSHLEANDPAKAWTMAIIVFAKTQSMHKWSKWAKKLKTQHFLFDSELTKSAVKRKGAIKIFESYGIIIPEGSLRIRKEDALTPLELSKQNKQYRNRLLFGPSWRADIITLIEEGAKNPYQIAKTLGCSYEPAHRVFREYQLANGIGGEPLAA